jgi:hypothetical protein
LEKNDTTSNIADVVVADVVSSPATSYIVQIRVVDDIGESAILEFKIPTDHITVHLKKGGKGVGIGKYSENDNCLEIAPDWDIKVYGDRWKSIGLSANVSDEASNTGRNGVGCYYRVENGNHVYVAFNCACTYSGSPIQVNADAIPTAYRPKRNIYAMSPTGGRAVARTIVTNGGLVIVDWIQIIPTTEATTSSTVSWIDGYIDYWI